VLTTTTTALDVAMSGSEAGSDQSVEIETETSGTVIESGSLGKIDETATKTETGIVETEMNVSETLAGRTMAAKLRHRSSMMMSAIHAQYLCSSWQHDCALKIWDSSFLVVDLLKKRRLLKIESVVVPKGKSQTRFASLEMLNTDILVSATSSSKRRSLFSVRFS
jgi:hypothetical protein